MQSQGKPQIQDVRKIVFSKPSNVPTLETKKEYQKTIDNSIGSQVNMRVHKYQAIMIHSSLDMLHPLTDNYPLGMSKIVNKPIIAYQLEYLQRFGIQDIMITVIKKYAKKIQTYLEKYYVNLCEDPNIELIVFADDIDQVNALLAVQPKVYTNLIVMEPDVLTDVPLDEIVDTHYLSQSAFTVLGKEFDQNKTSKAPKIADVEATDIFGLSTITQDQIRLNQKEGQFNRVVLRTDQSAASVESGEFEVKNSLTKKCGRITIRSDLVDCGVYIISHQCYKLIHHVNEKIEEVEWFDISENLLPFLATNQFKKNSLIKMYEEANGSKSNKKSKQQQNNSVLECANKIQMLMNPDKEINYDPVRIMMHIDPSTSQNNYMRIKSIDTYKKANLEGQKLVIKCRQMANQNKLFSNTKNTIPDLMNFNWQDLVGENVKMSDSNISLIDGKLESIQIGDASIIQKSVIGKNVKIGANTKIQNSVIAGDCVIGNNCQILNCLILSKCTIGDKQQLKEQQIDHGTEIDTEQ